MLKSVTIGILVSLFLVIVVLLYRKTSENFEICYPGYAKTNPHTSFHSPFKGWCDDEATVLKQESEYGYRNIPFEVEDEFSDEDNICPRDTRVSPKKSYNSDTKGWCKRNDYGY